MTPDHRDPFFRAVGESRLSRPKQTAELAALKGQTANHSRDRANNTPSEIEASKPKCPSWLSKVGKKEFRKMAKILGAQRKLTAADYSVLAIHASNHERYVDCLQYIRDHGHFDDEGDENGASKLATRLAAQIRLTLNALSATPVTREKSKPTAPPKNSMEPIPGSVEDLLMRRELYGVVPAHPTVVSEPIDEDTILEDDYEAAPNAN